MKRVKLLVHSAAERLTLLDWFHVVVVAMHGLAAIVMFVLFLVPQCSLRDARQPLLISGGWPLPANASAVWAFRDASPWRDDITLDSLGVNPFELVFIFEWITTGCAMIYLINLYPAAPSLAWKWQLGGVVVYCIVLIADRQFNVVSAVLILELLAAALLCFRSVRLAGLRATPAGHMAMEEISLDGRTWRMPSRVAALKLAGDGEPEQPGEHHPPPPLETQEDMVVLRYTEYAITAPVLFLAVMCLLITDAPAWLALTGFFALSACNLLGIPLHMDYQSQWHLQGLG